MKGIDVMNNKRIISPAEALEAVCGYAGLGREELYGVKRSYDRGYYEISFCTDWQSYDCYVDAVTAEVAGLSASPIPPIAEETWTLRFGQAERAAG